MKSNGFFDLARGSDNPWDRLKGETSKAFEAFASYRDMGATRSTAKVGQALGKSKALIDRWCSQWQWVDRVKYFETHLDRTKQKELLEARKDMIERHAKYGRWLQAKAAQLIAPLEGDKLTIEQARRYMELGVKIEREALGAPKLPDDDDLPVDDGLGMLLAGLDDEDLSLLLENLQLILEDE